MANDIKTEAQQDLQKMIMENKAHRERVRQLEAQIDKLKGKLFGSSSINQYLFINQFFKLEFILNFHLEIYIYLY